MNSTRILLADDDDEFLEILQAFLFARGYECEVTYSGLECLDLLRLFVPHVLVLDSDLLWGGAEGVLSRMWEEPCLRHVSVILTSGERAVTRPRTLASPPVTAQLVKPFSLHQFLAAIHAARRRQVQVAHA